MTTAASLVNLFKVPVGAVLFGAFAAADLWHFHSLASTTDFGVLVACAGALGISTAYGMGQAVTVSKLVAPRTDAKP